VAKTERNLDVNVIDGRNAESSGDTKTKTARMKSLNGEINTEFPGILGSDLNECITVERAETPLNRRTSLIVTYY
jgi:hypothetical protein